MFSDDFRPRPFFFFHRFAQRIVKKRIPVLITELFTGKNLFDFAFFIKYFDFMKHGTLQTYSYPGDIRPGLEV